ncbi:uncharacterized protein [Hetaerina americana]|uniref:uncharacterized protein isoform X2 n=1 Tax=Hetaerina americana TaxID=62018 RepID=UPI003A7F3AD9
MLCSLRLNSVFLAFTNNLPNSAFLKLHCVLSLHKRKLRLDSCNVMVRKFSTSRDDASSNPSKGILHNVAAQVKAKLNVDMDLQYITRDITVNPRDIPIKETTLLMNWPEPYKTYGQGRSKKLAEHDAADRAIIYLKSLNLVTDDGRLSIGSGGGGGKHGSGDRRRNVHRKRGEAEDEDGRKRRDRRRDEEGTERRRKWDREQTGNRVGRGRDEKDVSRGGRQSGRDAERAKCSYKEVDWWNKDGVRDEAMDEEVEGDLKKDGTANEDEGVVEDWWDRASEDGGMSSGGRSNLEDEPKAGTKRVSHVNSPAMEPSKRLCSRQDEESGGKPKGKSSTMNNPASSRNNSSITKEPSPPPLWRLRGTTLGEEADRLRKGLALGPLDDSYDTADLEKISRQFPSCKNTLHNVFAAVAQEYRDPSMQPKPVYRALQNMWPSKSWRSSQKSNGYSGEGWQCSYNLMWPEIRSFTGEARAKAAAATQAALKALLWLRQNGRVGREGNVIFNPSAAAAAANAFRRGEPEEPPSQPRGGGRSKGGDVAVSNPSGGAGATVVAMVAPIDRTCLRETEELLEKYHQDVEPLLSEFMKSSRLKDRGTGVHRMFRRYTSEYDGEDDGSALAEDDGSTDVLGRGELSDPITGRRYEEPDARRLTRRSEDMLQRIFRQREAESGTGDSRMAAEWRRFRDIQDNLPIAKFRQEIINLVDENHVVVVTGEAGCGKSTQVPQFILDEWAARGRGGHCNIVVTQPRRISATSLAERVAHERLERVGDTVGYQVRLESRLPSSATTCGGGGGAILFCSVGILLRRLQTNPRLIGASHIILDEAHQRDVGTDVLATLLRRALASNPSLRLVVMSATLDAPLFSAFFGNAPTVHVPGFTYPVKEYYLEELESEVMSMRRRNGNSLSSLHSASEEESGGAVDFDRLRQASERPNPVVDCEQVARVVRWVDSSRPSGGAVLVFLPGWAEIKAVATALEKPPVSRSSRCASSRLLILPVHSRLSHAEQRRIFDRAPNGTRKVIVATDVAETGITVDDVEYVVDTGAHREERFDAEKGVSCVDVHWASAASIRQRRGRAGRVRPGQSFHLFTRSRQEALLPYPLPEVHRVPLEKTVLDCKTYSRDMRAAEFLSEMPEPPPTDSVVQAVRELVGLGALEEGPEERLTPLGRRIALFTTHPKLSKALVHAAIFRCVSPLVTIATVLSVEREPFQSALVDKAGVRAAKSHFCPTSDHLALSFMHEKWEEASGMANCYGRSISSSSLSSDSFCANYGLSRESMSLIQSLRRIYAEHLYQSRLLSEMEGLGAEAEDEDNNWGRRGMGGDNWRNGRSNNSSMTWSSWRRGRGAGSSSLDGLESFANRSARCNQLAAENELVLGVLLSGVGSILRRRQWDVRKGKVKKNAPTLVTDDGQRATLGSESVNNGRWGESRSPPFLTYFRQVRSQERKSILVREASLVSPISILLFANPQGRVYKVPRKLADSSSQVALILQGKKELELHCDERQAQMLVGLREAMWQTVEFFVREEGRISTGDPRYRTISGFHQRLLRLLPELLRSDPTVPKDAKGGSSRDGRPIPDDQDSRFYRNSAKFPELPSTKEKGPEQRDIKSLLDIQEIREIRSSKGLMDTRDLRNTRDSKGGRDMRDSRESNLSEPKENRSIREVTDVREVRDMRDSKDVRDIRPLRDVREVKDSRESLRDAKAKDNRESRDIRSLRDVRDSWEARRDSRDTRESWGGRDSTDAREPKGLRDVRDSRDAKDTRDLRDLRDSRDIRDSRDMRDSRDIRDIRDIRDSRDIRDLRDSRHPRDLRDTRDSRDLRDSRDIRDLRDVRNLRDVRDSWDPRDSRDVRDSRDLRDSRDTRDTRDSRGARDFKDFRDCRDSRDFRDAREGRDTRDLRDLRDVPEGRDMRGTRDSWDYKDSRDMRDSKDSREARDSRHSKESWNFSDTWDSRDSRGLKESRDAKDSRDWRSQRGDTRDYRDLKEYRDSKVIRDAHSLRDGTVMCETKIYRESRDYSEYRGSKDPRERKDNIQSDNEKDFVAAEGTLKNDRMTKALYESKGSRESLRNSKASREDEELPDQWDAPRHSVITDSADIKGSTWYSKDADDCKGHVEMQSNRNHRDYRSINEQDVVDMEYSRDQQSDAKLRELKGKGELKDVRTNVALKESLCVPRSKSLRDNRDCSDNVALHNSYASSYSEVDSQPLDISYCKDLDGSSSFADSPVRRRGSWRDSEDKSRDNRLRDVTDVCENRSVKVEPMVKEEKEEDRWEKCSSVNGR